MPTITLIGYRGTGKSTVAVELARRLGTRWCDADVELEAELGLSIAEMIRSRGEQAFREEESRLLKRLLSVADGVLATGGGVVLAEDNRRLLRSQGGLVVWLMAPADVVRSRLAADPATASRRPGLTGADPLAEVAKTIRLREPLYRECAGICIDAAAAPPAAVAEAILARLDTGHRAQGAD
ncbi:MAG: shikimate kinase [Planctomycetota bacterium]|nr:MAG: shikimate kinase [Planctomycetota bacterium]